MAHHDMCNDLMGCHPDCPESPPMRPNDELATLARVGREAPSPAGEYGPWTFYYVCSKCEEYLSDYTFYYGNGLCPHCGHYSASTICDAKKVVRRKRYTSATNQRRQAIEAQKRKKSSLLVRLLHTLRSILPTMPKRRPFVWEYRDGVKPQ